VKGSLTDPELLIRQGVLADSKAIWEINRQPIVRQAAFSSEDIPWASHERWFSAAITDPNRLFLLGCIEQRVAGVARFDRVEEGLLEITIAMAEEFRGQGLGRRIIRETSLKSIGFLPSSKGIRAHIKHENQPSIRAFEAAGFEFCGETWVKGRKVLQYRFLPYAQADNE